MLEKNLIPSVFGFAKNSTNREIRVICDSMAKKPLEEWPGVPFLLFIIGCSTRISPLADDTLSTKALSVLILLTPNHRTKSAIAQVIEKIPVSICKMFLFLCYSVLFMFYVLSQGITEC